MNRSKKLYILLGVLAFFCIATFALTKVEENKEEIKNSDEIILEIASDTVTALSWEYDSDTFSFSKGDTWQYESDVDFPVDEEKINELLSVFESFGVAFVIENVEDYSQYGLDDPTCTISLTTEELSYEVKLGEFSTMDSQRYVSIGDGNVYLVSEDPFDYYEVVLDDMIDHDEAPGFSEVSKISLWGQEKYEIQYIEDSEETYCADDVYFAKQDEKNVPLDTDNVESYLDSITELSLKDYATYKVTEEELESYGLNDPELTVTINYTSEEEEKEFVLYVGCEEKEDEEDEAVAYVRIGESQIVYNITADEYENLMKASYNDLRHKQLLTADFDDIYKIDVVLEGETYTITSEEEKEELVYYYNEEVVDIATFKTAVASLEANSFTTEEATEKEEISFKVYLDNEKFPEIEITLYRYDGSDCLAVVDGEPVALVARANVVDVIEAINEIVL